MMIGGIQCPGTQYLSEPHFKERKLTVGVVHFGERNALFDVCIPG